RSLWGLAAGAPHRRRVAAHRAEAPKAGEIESAEAAHREAADRDPRAVRAVAANRCGDDLVEDVGAPAALGPVVVVRMVAAVREDDDRRPGAEPLQSPP